jgi:hypothetical protein
MCNTRNRISPHLTFTLICFFIFGFLILDFGMDSGIYLSLSLSSTKTEGKFSFPILHCIRQDPKDTRLSSILKQRTSDDQVKRYAQTILRDAGSLTYTREKCTNLKNDILQQILILGGNRPLETLIQLLDVQLEKLDPSIVPSQLVPSSPSSTTTSNEPQQNPQTSSNISPSTSWRIDST